LAGSAEIGGAISWLEPQQLVREVSAARALPMTAIWMDFLNVDIGRSIFKSQPKIKN
jgi:hypothetical protein